MADRCGLAKLITRIPAGQGSHGTAVTPSGKLYITNTNDNNVTVIDIAGQKVVATIPVGQSPNGLTYMPAPQRHSRDARRSTNPGPRRNRRRCL